MRHPRFKVLLLAGVALAGCRQTPEAAPAAIPRANAATSDVVNESETNLADQSRLLDANLAAPANEAVYRSALGSQARSTQPAMAAQPQDPPMPGPGTKPRPPRPPRGR